MAAQMPQVKRPLGIAAISASVLALALALLARTITLHVSGVAGLASLVAVLALVVSAIGLWWLRNGSRIFLLFLAVLDALSSIVALAIYALRRSNYRLSLWLIAQLCVAALLIWYLQSRGVRRAFGGVSAWPRTVQMLMLTIFTVPLAFPFYWMIIATFKQNVDLYEPANNPFVFNVPATLDHLKFLFRESGYVTWLTNTAIVGALVVIITLVLALPAAYALARLTGRWGERLGIAIFLTYLVPPTLLFIPLSWVIGRVGLQDSWWSLVLVDPSITVPFSIWLLMGFFKSIPKELEDAAMVDGLTRFGAFIKMVIPISISGILTVVIFTFTLVTQEFVYALTFISPEKQQMVGVGVPIFLVRGDVYYWGGLMAACLIASIPIAFIYNLFLNRFIAGFTVGAVKG